MKQIVAFTCLAFVAACSTDLGTFTAGEGTSVADLPEQFRHARKPQRYWRVEIASKRDLSDKDLGSLYVVVDTCPLDREKAVIGFGPFTSSGAPLPGDERLVPQANGRFSYVIYLPLEDDDWRERFSGASQLCAAITHPEYPREALSKAFTVELPN